MSLIMTIAKYFLYDYTSLVKNVLHQINIQKLTYQYVLHAFKNKFLSAGRNLPEDISFSRKRFLLQRVVDVERMLGPTVDERKWEISADVELALQDGVHAGDVPVFIVTVVWQNDASTEKWLSGN